MKPLKSLFVLVVALTITTPLHAIDTHRARKPITVQLKWKHQFQFAGFYAALEKGIYANAGFDVQLKQATGDTNSVEEVLAGRADFGVANSELLLYRLLGKPVTALAVIIQHCPLVLLSLKDSNILSPHDLIGKRVMFPEGVYGASTQSVLLHEGVRADQLTQVPITYDVNDLINKKVDAMVGYITDQPYHLKRLNVAYNVMNPGGYGIDFYGDTLFTTERRVSNKLEEVMRFREATLEGWRYAINHSDEIIHLIKEKYQSEKSLEELRYEADVTIKLIVPELVSLGHMNSGRWQSIASVFKQLGLASSDYYDERAFIFSAEQRQLDNKLTFFSWVLFIIVTLAVSIVLTLTTFSKRLKVAVANKTHELEQANEVLIKNTEELLDTQTQLSLLTQVLEERIQVRTETLEKTNLELKSEIETRREREHSLQLFLLAIEHSSSSVIIINDCQKIVYVSRALRDLLNYELESLAGNSLEVLRRFMEIPDLDWPVLKDGFKVEDGFKEVFRQEVKCTTASGSSAWMQMSISPIYRVQQSQPHFVIVCENITQIKQRKDEMEKLAFFDTLTGLQNRLLFKSNLQEAVERAREHGKLTALLFVDLDNFKNINDSLGHDAGDIVLRAAAERLSQHVRDQGSVARISGDEFAILLTNIHSKEYAGEIAAAILKELSAPILCKSRECFITASIGISVTPTDTLSQDELTKNADIAMYQAKKSGKNHFCFYSLALTREVRRKIQLEQNLRQSLGRNEFYLEYQPKISMDDLSLVGLEALIRWREPGFGVRNPSEFIGIAEDSGFIIPLGNWIIHTASKALGVLRRTGIAGIKLSINLSPRQMRDKNLLPNLQVLREEGRSWIDDVELEITETCLIENMQESIQQLVKLRERGFSLAIDDFGTGYSNLSYLKQLPIDTIKIDKSFLQDIPTDKNNVEIVSAVIAMAHKLNLKVVAEGVETAEQFEFLQQCRCDQVQGYYLCKPIGLNALIERYQVTH